jgi:hypothetical protein
MFDPNIFIRFDGGYLYTRSYIDRIAHDNNFVFIGEGRHRRTFFTRSKKNVIKFPINAGGLRANQYEYDQYKTYYNGPDKDGIVYAPCRLIKNCVLIMVAIQDDFGFGNDNIPDPPYWVTKVDCEQVGILKNGRIVAYDSYEDS